MPVEQALLKQRAYINGQWVGAGSGAVFPVRNPATGEVLAEVPDMSGVDAQTAIEAAHQALSGWREEPAGVRAQYLRDWHQRVLDNADALASLITAEQGKPLAEAQGEVRYAASYLLWYAEEARRIQGDIGPGAQAEQRMLVLRQPVGVVAAITPWNFPLAMITRKCAPALAAGCTMVLKPAEATPLSALALAELAGRAGIPDGVFSVVTAAKGEAVGAELTRHPLVRKLSFTGSTATGKLLARQCADTVKRVSLELGGQAPFIVLDDADIDAAVTGALQAKGRNGGQTCIAANRFLVHETIYAEFADKLSAAYSSLTVGDGAQPGVEQGPLINAAAAAKVSAHVADAIDQGARLRCGGQTIESGADDVWFYQPTVLDDVSEHMLVAREETFGPVVALLKFSSDEEALRLANATSAGLAAYLFSRDMSRIWRMAEALEFGMVGINTGIISSESAPFGGIKESGIGREGGRYGIDEYLEYKYLALGGLVRQSNKG